MKLFNHNAKEVKEDNYTEELERIASEGAIFVDDKDDEEEKEDLSYIDNYNLFVYDIDR